MAQGRWRSRMVAVFAATTVLLAACGDDDDDVADAAAGGGELAGVSLEIGTKEFTESRILGEITAAVLAAAGAETSITELFGSATVREALENGEVDMYWEYTGTGWVNILGRTTTKVPANLFAKVSELDAANGVVWLDPAPMNDTYRVAITRELAEAENLSTMSAGAAYAKANDSKICAASEFINRDDGLPGVQQAYGAFTEVVELDLGLIYTQIGKKCDFGEVFSTDGRILANDLVVLADDKKFFIDYNAALTLRQEVLEAAPTIRDLMAPISLALTDAAITAMNAAVDVDGKEPAQVAAQWLAESGLLV